MASLLLDASSADDYQKFLQVKSLPSYRFAGRTAIFPDEYLATLGMDVEAATDLCYEPIQGLFDYQEDITRTALNKEKYAVFADCGLGKTLILLEFARTALDSLDGKSVLIISPLMVIPQTVSEAERFYNGGLSLSIVAAKDLTNRLKTSGGEILITNYDALRDETPQGNVGALILDESSMLKSHYGRWSHHCLRIGAGLRFKLACTGTPAPNDRIEYANHAVFLDAFPTVNAFLARFFVNKGQTSERWVLKPHALRPFYRALSHWCIFLTNPATYGWTDNTESIPPIKIHIHDIPLTDEQQLLAYERTGTLFADQAGGITSRSVLSQIAKGSYRGKAIDTVKPAAIRSLVEQWPDESTIIWCKYNAEQEIIERAIPDAVSIKGSDCMSDRMAAVESFKNREVRTLISKPKILGFGLNLHVATRQIFSGLQDSYEEFYQAVKRSNRYGSTLPLNVHIPVTDIERPMIQNVLDKAKRVQHDTEEQERIFKEAKR